MKTFSPRQQFELLVEMARCDFKLRDQGTFFGFLWTLLNPALTFAVLFTIFRGSFGNRIPGYPAYLLIGIVQWNFFATATLNATTILDRKRFLITNFNFPRWIAPAAAVATIFLSYTLECLLVFVILACGSKLNLRGAPVFLLFMLLNLGLSLGVGIILSYLHLLFRDVEQLWSLVLRIGFIATPIFYPAELLSATQLAWLRLNPFYSLLEGSRRALIEGTQDVFSAASAAIAIVFLAMGARLVSRWIEPLIAERL